MALVISQKIREKEFGGAIPADAMEVLLRSSRAALATPIAGKGLPCGTRLLKAYATSAGGPRRIVYLLEVEGGDLFLVFYRSKNDDVGANISTRNPAFALQLKKHLAFLSADIKAGLVDVIETAVQ
jgi:hypothetical protein